MQLVVLLLLVVAFCVWAIMVLVMHMLVAALAESARYYWDRRILLVQRAINAVTWPALTSWELVDDLYLAVRRRW